MLEMLAEGTVERISFDYGIELNIDGAVVLRIEGQARLVTPDGHVESFDAEVARQIASPLLA